MKLPRRHHSNRAQHLVEGAIMPVVTVTAAARILWRLARSG